MARRPSSRSSSGRAPAKRQASPTHEVHCPDCGTSYRVPEEKLDAKVQCRRCRRIFTPINILRKSSRRTKGPGGPSAAMVSGIIAVVAVIVFAVIFSQSLQEDEPIKPPEESTDPGTTAEEFTLMKRPTIDLEKWITAVIDADNRALERLTHLESFYLTYPEKERPQEKGKALGWADVDPVEKIEWRSRIFMDLAKGHLNAPFEGKRYISGTCIIQGSTRAPLVKKEIKAEANFQVGQDIRKVYTLGFDMKNMGSAKKPKWQVAAVAIVKSPTVKKKKKPKKVPKGLDSSKMQKAVNQKGEVITTHPVVPLGHLEDTPQALRDEIDSLIATVADPKTRRKFGRAANRLIEIGRPAFPRLLNLFYDIDQSDDPHSRDSISILVRLIKNIIVPMTDCDYGYDPSPTAGNSPEEATANRQVALKRYYGWWGKHSSKAYWKLLEEKRNAPIEGL